MAAKGPAISSHGQGSRHQGRACAAEGWIACIRNLLVETPH
ncbi:hypothetical protein A3768_2237 [Ralstonia solanacearum]|nr:hypothetical protein A3768_2237 [Ralstonia solanacearum]